VIAESKDDIKKSEDRKEIDHGGEGGMHDVRMGALQRRRREII
jgi:hypothetical protein